MELDMRDTTLGQETGEPSHDVAHKINHLMKCWEERFTFNNPRFSERYIKSKLHFLIHFSIRSIDEEFVACFQREHSFSGLEKGMERRNVSVLGERLSEQVGYMGTEVHTAECASDHNYETVFVDVIKFVEDPECIIPTLVRFGGVNSIYSILPHSLYFSWRLGHVFRGVIRNGEVDVLRWTARRPARSNHEQGVGQMIKGAPQVLKNLSSDSRNSLRDIPNAHQVIDQLSGLRIVLSSDCVAVGVEKGFEFWLQITDVLFGPLDFDPDPIC